MQLTSLLCPLLVLSLFAALPASAQSNNADRFNCDLGLDAGNYCIVKQTQLPLRLLTKPRTSIYSEMDARSDRLEDGLPTFTTLIATSINDVNYNENNFEASGWFGVSKSPGSASVGFVRAADVVEWKNGLLMTYTNPELAGRNPALMFGSEDDLWNTLVDIDDGLLDAQSIYDRINDGDVPAGIISREPSAYVDFSEQFYLLPILAWEDVSNATKPYTSFALQLAAATEVDSGADGGACDLRGGEIEECDQGIGDLSNLDAFDVVFVIDLTRSMDPYINSVARAVGNTARRIEEAVGSADKIKFGLVGYRDDVDAVPEMEFTARNFTPDLLPADEFAQLMEDKVRAATVDNNDFPEEVFAGLQTAILDTQWSDTTGQEGIRFIILIGDASSHPIDAPRNTTDLNAEAVANLARDFDVTIASLHISKSDVDRAIAEQQFRTVAGGSAEGVSSYHAIRVQDDASGSDSLEQQLRTVTTRLARGLTGDLGALSSDDPGAASSVLVAAKAAIVDYLGDDLKPPSNIVAWTLDNDLANPQKSSFDVKVLLDRGQLQFLADGLETTLEAFQAQQTSSTGAFLGTIGAATSAAYDLLDLVDDNSAIGESDLLPNWLDALPYKSRIMSMTLDEFKNSPPQVRQDLEDRLNTLVQVYSELLNRPQAWRTLNEDDTLDKAVTFISLNDLP